jgi:hypothetical protein
MRETKSRGQASFEYILTALVIGVTIIPAAYLFYQYSSSAGDQIDKTQMDKLGRDLASTAEKVYLQGAPSRMTLEARMPKGVANVSIIGGWNKQNQMILITAGSTNGAPQTEYPYPVSVNINGTFNLSLYEQTVGAGIKKINVEAYEIRPNLKGEVASFVLINFGGRCPRSSTYDFDGGGLGQTDYNFLFLTCKGKTRPSKFWEEGWFPSVTAAANYKFCMNSDYNGDCRVDKTDTDLWCDKTGYSPPGLPCKI